MQEKIELKALLEASEKIQLSVIDSPDLEPFSPYPESRHLQKVLKEGILLATGGVAILLQMANPQIAQAVNENSNFANRPADRLRTMTYMYCMLFGTPREKQAVIAKVHQAHPPVKRTNYCTPLMTLSCSF